MSLVIGVLFFARFGKVVQVAEEVIEFTIELYVDVHGYVDRVFRFNGVATVGDKGC